ncbi:MAG: hypothetical protein D6771_03490, partial [Zetaproteobacteria bacterium]
EVRYMPDAWPPVWLGVTIEEELAFGHATRPSPERMRQALARWGVRRPLDAPLEGLTRREAVGVYLAAFSLSGAFLWLLDQPVDALAPEEARFFAEGLVREARSAGRIVVVAACRRQDWPMDEVLLWDLDARR